jgi:hypothetical protein
MVAFSVMPAVPMSPAQDGGGEEFMGYDQDSGWIPLPVDDGDAEVAFYGILGGGHGFGLEHVYDVNVRMVRQPLVDLDFTGRIDIQREIRKYLYSQRFHVALPHRNVSIIKALPARGYQAFL